MELGESRSHTLGEGVRSLTFEEGVKESRFLTFDEGVRLSITCEVGLGLTLSLVTPGLAGLSGIWLRLPRLGIARGICESRASTKAS